MARFFLTVPMVMVALFLGLAVPEADARSVSRRFGSESAVHRRSMAGMDIDPREIDLAVDLLRRVNYDFVGHAHNELEKRGSREQQWTMTGGGYSCQVRC